MQTFTKRELECAADAVAGIAKQLTYTNKTAVSNMERSLSRLRAEQLQSISDRLIAAVANGDKQIAIQ